MTLLLAPDAIDIDIWPDVARTTKSPVRAAVARRLWRRAVARLPLRVQGDGAPYGGGDGDAPVLTLRHPSSFFHRLGAGGTIGFGEAYMAGDWTAEDLTGVIAAFAANLRDLVPASLQRLRHAVLRRQPGSHDNTLEGARVNIRHHYDLSNELFTAFLDPSMTYSSAYFADELDDGADLTTAQHRKIDRLLDITGVRAGRRVLEIGTGWGELAIRAAQRGAHVTTATISAEQAALANERVRAAGLSDRVDILLRDYRHVEGEFDAVVSVEMIEAVGANHWDEYFATLDRTLAPGGKVGLQAILQDDDTLRRTQDTYTWMRKYIFPGGQLMSLPAIDRVLARATSLRVTESMEFGRHYAETLRRWRARFEAQADTVSRLGFDATFRRMWSLYLAYCEAGFSTGYLNVTQLSLARLTR